jgi:hypothetical protein
MSNEYKDWLRDEQVDRLLAEIEKAKPVLDAAEEWAKFNKYSREDYILQKAV